MESDQTKTCTGCGETKPLTEFHKYSRNKVDGRQPKCKTCQAAYHSSDERKAQRKAAYHADDKGREYARKRRQADPDRARVIRRDWQFSLKPGQYDKMHADQNGLCAICSGEPDGRWAALVVDHDRKCCTGSKSCGRCVRGLLCSSCNAALGLFGDSIETLRSAITYLGRFT